MKMYKYIKHFFVYLCVEYRLQQKKLSGTRSKSYARLK